jgi:hypothetical protein
LGLGLGEDQEKAEVHGVREVHVLRVKLTQASFGMPEGQAYFDAKRQWHF